MSDPILWLDIAQRGRPPTRIEARRPNLHLVVGDTVGLTARIDDDFYGYAWSRGHVASVLSPWSADDARIYDGERWLHATARALRESPASPLYAGTWALGPWTAVHPVVASCAGGLLRATADDSENGHTEWDIGDLLPPLLLRAPPPASDGRVKAWRKFAREGRLPPLLLWWVSGLDRFVVLDGAARLVAAIAEGTVPPALALAAARHEYVAPDEGLREVVEELATRAGSISAAGLNAVAVRAFGGERVVSLRTRAWPIPRSPT